MMKAIVLAFTLAGASGYLQQAVKIPKAESAVDEVDQKDTEDYVYKKLYGRVFALANNSPLEGILVEVYDHPEVAITQANNSAPNETSKVSQRKLTSCITGKDGMFRFDRIKSGKYEIRLTDVGGAKSLGPWEGRSWFITIDPQAHENVDKMIEVYMDLLI